MESLNSFIITLATIIIFISAVELIFPDNGFKKYQSFVLGLIVLAVILTPIVNFFNSSDNISEKIKASIDNIESRIDDKVVYDVEKNGEYVLYTLKNSCEKLLKENFEEKNFTVDIDGEINFLDYSTNIELVTVKVRDKVEFGPIIVNDSENLEIKESKLSNEVKDYLSNELKIDKKLIRVIEK